MLAWLWDVFVGRFCRHQWGEVESTVLRYDPDVSLSTPVRTAWVTRCSKCGAVRTWWL